MSAAWEVMVSSLNASIIADNRLRIQLEQALVVPLA